MQHSGIVKLQHPGSISAEMYTCLGLRYVLESFRLHPILSYSYPLISFRDMKCKGCPLILKFNAFCIIIHPYVCNNYISSYSSVPACFLIKLKVFVNIYMLTAIVLTKTVFCVPISPCHSSNLDNLFVSK